MDNDKIIPRVSIKETPDGTEITINGKKIEGVCKYRVEHEGGKLPVLCLEFLATKMEVNGKMIPALPEIFRGFYKPIHTDNPESIQ